MKVLHVIPSVSPARGGPSEALRVLVDARIQEGVEVDVATTDDDGPRARRRATDCFCFPRQTSFYSFSWPLTTWLMKRARDYDLLHIHGLFSYAPTAAALIAKSQRVPYILRPLGTLAPWGMSHRRPGLKRLS